MIKPLNKRVLVKKIVAEVVTSSGIEVVSHAKTTRNTTVSEGVIEAVGDGSEFTVGATVLFDEGWGNEVEEGLFLVTEDAVLAYVD